MPFHHLNSFQRRRWDRGCNVVLARPKAVVKETAYASTRDTTVSPPVTQEKETETKTKVVSKTTKKKVVVTKKAYSKP